MRYAGRSPNAKVGRTLVDVVCKRYLQLSSSTLFQSGNKILRHSGQFFLLHPDVGGVFAEARSEGDSKLRDLFLHHLELFQLCSSESEPIPLSRFQCLPQVSEAIKVI